jgi:hypothetical protein
VKFVKGVAIFLVLCFAAYGAFMLLKPTPKGSLSADDTEYLARLGFTNIQDGQAADSGISDIFSVQGLPPMEGFADMPFDDMGSYAPPSVLFEPTPSVAEPVPPVAAPCFDGQPVLDSVPDFSSQEAIVLPPPNVPAPFEAPAIPASESPPPLWDSWDGPAAVIPATPPPARPLQSPNTSPIYSTTPFAEANVRRIAPLNPANETISFSSSDSVPIDAATMSVQSYTKTSARQPRTFEPVQPEIPPNSSVVSFGQPKRTNPVEQTPTPQPPEQPVVAARPASEQTVLPQRERQPVVQPLQPAAIPASDKPAISETVGRFIQSQRTLIESGVPDNIRLAFRQLSQLYEHELLSDAERAAMRHLLDPLALKVIYARDVHLLELPYRVQTDETVDSIAKKFKLTPALLRKINGITVLQELPAGATLKVVHGQFDARISVKRRELTLLVGGLYAGRFPFTLVNVGTTARGDFYVTRRLDRTMVLSNGLVLGTVSSPEANIVFSEEDAREIFDILSEQSVIVME